MNLIAVRARTAFRGGIVSLLLMAGAAAATLESTPLPARPLHFGPLFESLPASRSGLELVHVFPTNAPRALLQEQGAGAGICAGDIDGDGLPDLLFSNYDQGCRLYRNLGHCRFIDVTDPAGVRSAGRWCTGVTMVDIDNDGDLDLHVCCLNSPNLLYLNRGDGTFVDRAGQLGIAWRGTSVMGAFGDFDRDGRLDLYLLTHRDSFDPRQGLPLNTADAARRGILKRESNGKPEVNPSFQDLFELLDKGEKRMELSVAGQADQLFRQNPDGTFSNVSIPAGIQGHDIGLGVSWWDFDGDHWPDIYVANDHKTPDRLWRNNRDGTFSNVAAIALPLVPRSSMGTDVADLNNDGQLDLLATDMAGSTYARRMMLDGESERHRWFLERSQPRQVSRNTLYLGTGGSRVLEAARLAGLAATDWTWSPKLGDFDNDGWVDLFVANGMSHDYLNGDVLARMSQTGSRGWIEQPVLKETNLAFRNRGDLRFERTESAWGLAHRSASFGATIADLDRDGDLDLVVMNLGEPVSLYRNTEATNHRVVLRLQGTPSNRQGVGARVTALTQQGLATRTVSLTSGFLSANEPIVHFGLGTETLIRELTIDWPSGSQQIFHNLAADRSYSVTESGPANLARPPATSAAPAWFSAKALGSPFVHNQSSFDDFARDPLLPWKLSQSGPGLAVGDVDGDGLEDFFLSGFNATTGPTGMLGRRQAGGPFDLVRLTTPESVTASEGAGAILFDADVDGDPDLYVVSGGVSGAANDPALQDHLYLNDGRGIFSDSSPETLPVERDAGSVVCAADFDRDGDLDLFVGGRSIPGGYPQPAHSHLLRNHQGRFTDVTKGLAPGIPDLGIVTGATWSDVDGDGWLDLLISQEWGPVKLFLNRQGQLIDSTMAAGFGGRSGLWQGLVSVDVDNDGDFDCVTANFGNNTHLQASAVAPSVLLRGDFAGGGSGFLFPAQFEDGALRSTRTRSILLAALPQLADVLPDFQALANASLTTLFRPETIAGAYRVEINTLESGVWLNDGHAHFTFRPLPRLAQLAPTWGLAAADFDGDGEMELCLAQNFRGAPVDTGPLNGSLGLVLRGLGDGHFSPLAVQESGWEIPDAARSIAITDLSRDGLPDLLVGLNGGPIIGITNRAMANNPDLIPLTIRLRGRTGNPTAVGARIEVRFNDNRPFVAEVHAGDGYLSQSSATQFVPHPAGRSVREIVVRWPDGQISTIAGSNTRNVELQEPPRK